MSEHFGATPEDWAHFDLILGLTEDLLPVVSNPNAEISPLSKMSGLGKTPSRYNKQRKVSGFANWTTHSATEAEIGEWSQEPDYGICIQTRTLRAIDVDISDQEEADKAFSLLKPYGFPVRTRSNSSKFLMVFSLPGDMPKRKMKTSQGIIEFLATGQQFIAVGTHTSGARYEWKGGLPNSIPSLTLLEFEALWSKLEKTLAIESSSVGKTTTRSQVLATAISEDPVVQRLYADSWVLSEERDGRLHIRCPFEADHSGPSAESSTTYFPANTGGYAHGNFVCLHAHCADRSQNEFKQAVGIADDDDLFSPVEEQDPSQPAAPAARFAVQTLDGFSSGPPPSWIIKDVLPKATLGVVYGDSGSGKSFFTWDMVCAIAHQGSEWRGRSTTHGPCVYIAAEGAGGFRKRVLAYSQKTGIPLSDIPVGIIGDAPNFMLVPDVKDVIASVKTFGRPSVIVIDTMAAVLPGVNENSGEDIGKALHHCQALHKHTGALVLLIHHSGKDASKGARGWSGLRAAADCMIEIARDNSVRVATITKQKDGTDENLRFGFELEVVDLGEETTSCVVSHNEYTPPVDHRIDLNSIVFAELSGLKEPVYAHEFKTMLATKYSGIFSPKQSGTHFEKMRKEGSIPFGADGRVLPINNEAVVENPLGDNEEVIDLDLD